MFNCKLKFDGMQYVLYGGKDFSGNEFPETWKWDGVNWALIVLDTYPSYRVDFGIARYGQYGLLLYGGYNSSDGYLNDTWSWDGYTWTELSPTANPGMRTGVSMCSFGDNVILYGGINVAGSTHNYFEDTWVFDGTWTRVNNSTTCPPNNSTTPNLYSSIVENNATIPSASLIGGGSYNTYTANNLIWTISETDYIWTSVEDTVANRFSFGLDSIKRYQ
jgi:hypothetical protein